MKREKTSQKHQTTTNQINRKTRLQQRRQQVLKLRKAGVNYQKIAEQLEISVAQAHRDCKKALEDITRDAAEELLELELNRLDDLLMAVQTRAMQGDLKALDRALKIMDRRAKYLGLDKQAPTDSSEQTRQALIDFQNLAHQFAHNHDADTLT